MGGQGRTEQDMDFFYETMGANRSNWQLWTCGNHFVNPRHHAPDVQIVFDKFHIMKHLPEALGEVRRSEYKRVREKDKRFIKGQRHTLLSHKSNLDIRRPGGFRNALESQQAVE